MREVLPLQQDASGRVRFAGQDLGELAERFGTPLYVYDETALRRMARAYRDAFTARDGRNRVVYAGKAFLVVAMAQVVAEEGLGLDVTSGGELYTALEGGLDPARIIFHGNAKTVEEIEYALEAGVGRFMVDNRDELLRLSALASERGRTAVCLLRVTPGIEAHTHDYIRTGQIDSKFGFQLEEAQEIFGLLPQLEGVRIAGVHCHVGSQILELRPFRETIDVMMDFLVEVRRRHGVVVEELDVGGGLGIRYLPEDDPPTPEDLARTLDEALTSRCLAEGYPKPALMVEPGRSLVGEAGITLYRVQSVKRIPGVRTYVAVDGGMGDNPRPALYQAVYQAVVVNRMGEETGQTVTLAGRYCESGDLLIQGLAVPSSVGVGDLVAVLATGAYNYSMASNYNRVPRPAVLFLRPEGAALVVERERLADLTARDRRLPVSAVLDPSGS